MMTLKLAWRNLWRNKRRTFITMASVFFAVVLAIFMRSLQEGTYGQMISNVVSFYSGYVQVHQKGYWDEQNLDNSFAHTPDLENQIAQHPQVELVVPRLEAFGLISFQDETASSMVVGIKPEVEKGLTELDRKVVAGEYLSNEQGGTMLAEGLAEKLGLNIGDTLVVIGQGYHGAMATGKYAVKGIVSFGSPDLNQRMLYLPLAEAQYAYGAMGQVTSYVLSLKDPQSTPEVIQALSQGLDTAQYEIMDWQTMMPELVQTIESDRAGGVVTIFILYLIIGFGIFGTVLMMTTERRYEFGVLTAIGMKRGKLSLTLIVESIIISMLGVLAGVAAALPLTWYFQENPIYMGEEMAEMYAEYGMDAVLPALVEPSLFIDQGIIILIVTLIISLYPLLKIRSLDPVKAMKA